MADLNCPNCGYKLASDDKFCMRCGRPVQSDSDQRENPEQFHPIDKRRIENNELERHSTHSIKRSRQDTNIRDLPEESLWVMEEPYQERSILSWLVPVIVAVVVLVAVFAVYFIKTGNSDISRKQAADNTNYYNPPTETYQPFATIYAGSDETVTAAPTVQAPILTTVPAYDPTAVPTAQMTSVPTATPTSEPTPVPTVAPTPLPTLTELSDDLVYMVEITGDTVNVRTAPNTGSNLIKPGYRGDRFVFVDQTIGTDGNVWFNISNKAGQTGWVSSQYSKIVIASKATPEPVILEPEVILDDDNNDGEDLGDFLDAFEGADDGEDDFLEESDDNPEYLGVMEVVNCDSWVSLRSKPSTKASRLAKVPLGEILDAWRYNDKFCECDYEEKTGYILTKYLRKVNQ